MTKNPAIDAEVLRVSQLPIAASLLDLVCKTTTMGFAAIAKVTESNWITCATCDLVNFGLKTGDELVLETTICNEIRQHQTPVYINEVACDPTYQSHHTPGQYGFQSYISVPILRRDGSFFGTLCALDAAPKKIDTAEVRNLFALFADLISFHLQASEELEQSNSALSEEKRKAELRDQFMAIVGHDLRNPVTSIMLGADMLYDTLEDSEDKKVIQTIRNSSYRMSVLIENMLDFARGRLGEGINVNPTLTHSLPDSLQEIINELKRIWPNTTIEADIQLTEPVMVDKHRIGQLFANLLGNALSHGHGKPVIIKADADQGLRMKICNQGEPIPPHTQQRLFQPFYRGDTSVNKKGLGLGLYIAHEIARGHGGSLTFSYENQTNCFTLQIPDTR